eukprot:15873224-Heterocapsa_arctica.AAC.1
MEVCVLPVWDQPAVDQRHHIVYTCLVVDDHEDVRRGSLENLNRRVELGSSCRLLRPRHDSMAVQKVPCCERELHTSYGTPQAVRAPKR